MRTSAGIALRSFMVVVCMAVLLWFFSQESVLVPKQVVVVYPDTPQVAAQVTSSLGAVRAQAPLLTVYSGLATPAAHWAERTPAALYVDIARLARAQAPEADSILVACAPDAGWPAAVMAASRGYHDAAGALPQLGLLYGTCSALTYADDREFEEIAAQEMVTALASAARDRNKLSSVAFIVFAVSAAVAWVLVELFAAGGRLLGPLLPQGWR